MTCYWLSARVLAADALGLAGRCALWALGRWGR